MLMFHLPKDGFAGVILPINLIAPKHLQRFLKYHLWHYFQHVLAIGGSCQGLFQWFICGEGDPKHVQFLGWSSKLLNNLWNSHQVTADDSRHFTAFSVHAAIFWVDTPPKFNIDTQNGQLWKRYVFQSVIFGRVYFLPFIFCQEVSMHAQP